MDKNNVRNEDCILLPTGDGMCIAFIGTELPYNIHMQMALNILEMLDKYNTATKDESRQFEVRIGINQNTDILVTDINDRRNIAGAGINMAARIMGQADGNQILVSQTVFDELQPSEMYMEKFIGFHAVAKHNLHFQVHQYLGEHIGLNVETPSAFAEDEEGEVETQPQLTEQLAYFMAYALKNRKFIAERYKEHEPNQHAIQILLWLLAKDSVEIAHATDFNPAYPRTKGFGESSFDKQYEHYRSQDWQLLFNLSQKITNDFSSYNKYFHARDLTLIFVNPEGEKKLREDWPSIVEEFKLDNIAE